MKYYDHILLLAALIAAVANTLQIADRFWKPNMHDEKDQKGRQYKIKTAITIIAILATIASIGAITYATSGSFKNEQLTREAWKLLDAKNYDGAIKKAEECVALFQDEALKEQKSLDVKGAPPPPKGKVSKNEKGMIFSRGLLNDVATCWFILGKAHTEKGDKEKAIKAFKKALLFPFARCYDPSNDFFWAPSDGAKVELKRLSGTSIYD
jgi:tetratricopeptide (TPR) repeat protein